MPERRNRPASRVYVETELELEEPAEDGGRYILEDLERLTVFHNNTSDRFVDLERLTVSPISRLSIGDPVGSRWRTLRAIWPPAKS